MTRGLAVLADSRLWYAGEMPTLRACKSVLGRPRSLLKVNGKAAEFIDPDLSNISGKTVIRKKFL